MVEELIIIPSIIIGAVIGLYELIVIHRDENFRGSHWFSHGLHAGIFAIIFTFASMNVDYVLSLINLPEDSIFASAIVFRAAVGLLAVIKVHAASAVVRTTVGSSRGLKQTWVHSFIVGALIVAAPYVYPLIQPIFPENLQ